MPNPCNVTPGVAADRRLQALVKQQAREHEHIISGYHKEMQELRDSLKLALEKFDSLYQSSEKKYQETFENIYEIICDIKNKAKSHEIICSEHNNTIKDIHNELCDVHLAFVTRKELIELIEAYDLKLKVISHDNLNSLQVMQQEFKVMLNKMSNDLVVLVKDIEKAWIELDEKIESNYVMLKMDKEGLLKEVRYFERNIFVIEKKIENLYTLIERINNRE